MNRDLSRRFGYMAGFTKRPKTLRCLRCKTKLPVKPRGRLPQFCCQTCRQRAYEKRKWGRPTVVEALAFDLAHSKIKAALRGEIWSLLQQVGLVEEASPPPITKPRRTPDLKLIKGGPDDQPPSD